ncbi:hypothetical protein MMC20_000999 [Loxospora ochrophaea]|nr:hypothetical protein [Loxospora ochrophaea]
MVLDPILRFNWIFYAIYSNDLQHSALLSFLVSFSEICRRAMWTLFRVENEHCTNVGRFRASRDIPLPYEIPSPLASTLESSEANDTSFEDPSSSEQRHRLINSLPRRLEGISSSADLEAATTAHATPSSDPLRQRKPPSTPSTPRPYGIARVGTMMAQAHAQDFERRRRPVVEELGGKDGDRDDAEGSTDEDEDEQDNEQDVTDVEEIMQRHGRAPQAP